MTTNTTGTTPQASAPLLDRLKALWQENRPKGMDESVRVVRAGLAKLREQLGAQKVGQEGALEAAAEVALRAKKAQGYIHRLGKAEVDPFAAALAEVKAFWKPLHGEAVALEADAKKLSAECMKHEREETERKLAEARRLEQEALDRQAAADREAREATSPKKKLEAELRSGRAFAEAQAAAASAPSAAPQTAVRTGQGMLYATERWSWEVTDAELLPEEYTKRVPDEERIEAAIASGTRMIQGLRIFPEEGMTARPTPSGASAGKAGRAKRR